MGKPEIWILLADSAHARVLRSPERTEPGADVPLETILEATTEHRPLRDIMADAPGRSFASVGTRRSAMEYHSDPVREETQKFARSIIGELDTRLAAGEFDEFVVCAPPRMLGILREVMPEKLAAVVRAEVGKDLTKLPELELRDAIRRLLAGPG